MLPGNKFVRIFQFNRFEKHLAVTISIKHIKRMGLMIFQFVQPLPIPPVVILKELSYFIKYAAIPFLSQTEALIKCNISIYLNQKITETDRAIRKTEQEIKRTEREIAQLRIRREQLSSWEYIGARIAYFKLGLREPAPGQVGRMALLSPRQAQMVPLESVASARRPSNAGRRN